MVWNRKVVAGAILIAAAVLIFYNPVLKAGFLEIWDDGEYVVRNPVLESVEGLRRIWLDPGATPQYYPMVHTTFWIEHSLWDLNPKYYHATNIFLHALNALLLWLLLAMLGVRGSWMAAAIFAVHPIHVESVAWITERKNTLSAFFYLSAFLSFASFYRLDSDEKKDRGERPPASHRLYALGFVFFCLALLSKTVTATLPAALLVVLWWKRGVLSRKDIVYTLPLFLIGGVMGLVTSFLEKTHVGAGGADFDFSFLERLLIAGRALWFYIAKILWPVPLTFFYPRWQINTSEWWQYLYPAAFILIGAFLWWKRGQIGRGPLAAYFFYLFTLAPALGFVNYYPMRYSFVADHFVYLASIGIFAALAALYWKGVLLLFNGKLWKLGGKKPKILGFLPVCGVLVFLGTLTWNQGGYYRSQESITRQNIEVNPESWIGQGTLGLILLRQGKLDEALIHTRRAVELEPGDPEMRNNYGVALQRKGYYEEALKQYQESLRIEPRYENARQSLRFLRIIMQRTKQPGNKK